MNGKSKHFKNIKNPNYELVIVLLADPLGNHPVLCEWMEHSINRTNKVNYSKGFNSPISIPQGTELGYLGDPNTCPNRSDGEIIFSSEQELLESFPSESIFYVRGISPNHNRGLMMRLRGDYY